MGLLVDGVWQDDSADAKRLHAAASIAPAAKFRNWVTPDGSPGPSGEGGFTAEPGRYHLYVSLACPWAHRTLIFRQLKSLEGIDLDLGRRTRCMGEHGWTFVDERRRDRRHAQRRATISTRSIRAPIRTIPAASPCRCCGTSSATPSSTTNSSEIIRMLNSAFDAFTDDRTDFYPAALRAEIDARQRAGLRRRQQRRLPRRLRHHAGRLRGGVPRRCSRRSTSWSDGCRAQRYLAGDRLTEADWRLFTTLVRFDPSMSATSNAICGASPTIRTCRTICAISTRCRASPRP